MSNAYEQMFFDTYNIIWTCDKNHRFGAGQIRSPQHCPECKSRLFQSLITKKGTPDDKPETVHLSPDEKRFLAGMR